MPRKRKQIEERTVSFLLNLEDKAVIDKMIDYTVDKGITEKRKINAAAGKTYLVNRDKMVSRLKFIYYYIYDYICENAYLYEDNAFVNINQEKMKKYLKTNSIAAALKNLIQMNIFECDYIQEQGFKSYGYKLVKSSFQYYQVESKLFSEKANDIASIKFEKIKKDKLHDYYQVLSRIKIDETWIKKVKKRVTAKKYKDEELKQDFEKFIRVRNLKFLINKFSLKLSKLSKSIYSFPSFSDYTIPFYNAQTVPAGEDTIETGQTIDAQTVPGTIAIDAQTVPDKYLAKHIVYTHYYVVRRDMRHKTISWLYHFRKRQRQEEIEDDRTTSVRLHKAAENINTGNIYVKRMNGKSRVYSNVTNLKREFRKHLLLDGKHLIGSDLSNSQPLIASILFNQYWKQQGNELPPDVLEYQRLCETGKFYDYFMELNEVPKSKGVRQLFKVEFFKVVFFSKHTDVPHVLKSQFVEKYPSCWEVIGNIKGGIGSMKYSDFAVLLQETEAEIFYDNVNMKLLKMGIDAFNIYDSIYVNNEEDYAIVNNLIMDFFKELGMSPKLQPEYYGKHKIKQGEMKKKYTVDELLSKKQSEKEVAAIEEQPSKLQHLKIGNKPSKIDEINRIAQGIKEQDAEEEERILNSIPQNEKEIHEFVLLQLQSAGEKTSKENIDYLSKVVREELKLQGIVIEQPKQSGYKYVNPYVKKPV